MKEKFEMVIEMVYDDHLYDEEKNLNNMKAFRIILIEVDQNDVRSVRDIAEIDAKEDDILKWERLAMLIYTFDEFDLETQTLVRLITKVTKRQMKFAFQRTRNEDRVRESIRRLAQMKTGKRQKRYTDAIDDLYDGMNDD